MLRSRFVDGRSFENLSAKIVLWTRAVSAGQGHVPSMLLAALQEHCPRFIESEPGEREPELLAFHLLEPLSVSTRGRPQK